MAGAMSDKVLIPFYNQFAAEGLGVPLEKITVVAADTATTDNSGSACCFTDVLHGRQSVQQGAGGEALSKIKS
jgi:hypothetical protein